MPHPTSESPSRRHDVVVIGGGAAGIAVTASLLKRRRDLDIAIVEPAEMHSYQPGWTMVGGGVFSPEITRRPMDEVIPRRATRYATRVEAVDPEAAEVTLADGRRLGYVRLVVAPGLVLDWGAIDGLEETLGQNGVTSNYRFDLAPYTWSLVQSLQGGRALFTQPPMPIKCAGAPQKAMYLSCDHWRREGRLGDIEVRFCNAGGVLFGVPDYVPALQRYIDAYGIEAGYGERLVAVDGPSRTARFVVGGEDGEHEEECGFDMLHAVPPQRAPGFIAESGLANGGGWLDLDAETLQHVRYPAVFGLGDVSGTTNAKTAAAVRMQAPVVAENLLASLDETPLKAAYTGYGSCPLTVERGRIVLAEFGYGGTLQPTFPRWVNDGTRATRRAWWLKAKQLPWLYWNLMLKGHEWLAAPARRAPKVDSDDVRSASGR
ncbi:NAD(P)/FAD-dependent oxidoreductase [Halomonas getboli]|uniref:NAD(P)/FAD-dependent oxidoreductase n=1 Tax=Halomonas getboli TaxID=2935862 RepID=UPI001FFF983C|nr:FAD/NAD(P)-binding oxidoreductase [Halomonas getboli]MCK2184444.1 NAD(P)/FAD-dependent oxidoreductase [Halomonas getboli]